MERVKTVKKKLFFWETELEFADMLINILYDFANVLECGARIYRDYCKKHSNGGYVVIIEFPESRLENFLSFLLNDVGLDSKDFRVL